MLYQKETEKALKNFPFGGPRVSWNFLTALVEIKKAAAIANSETGAIKKEISGRIVSACDEILAGKHTEQFPLPWLQGGAGTSVNMNVNEVIANIARCHPIDHVNRSMSTNDANPSALRIAAFRLARKLLSAIDNLGKIFEKKAEEFANVEKLARTHLQDAVPTTLGAEFAAYSRVIEQHTVRIGATADLMLTLNLGGTAIGSSVNASPEYRQAVYKELKNITGLKVRPAENLMAQTSSQTDFLVLSQAITAFCADLSKIAGDLRLMSSGPSGGLGEIKIRELQNGSSIMPGKVNPVLPEAVSQMYFTVSGNNLTIEQCVHAAQLELGVMLPAITQKLLETLALSREVIDVFAEKCAATIEANQERCKELLEKSTASAAATINEIGYDKATLMVKEKI